MASILSSRSTQDLVYNILMFLLYLFIVTFILKYLWNNTLTKYITILRPINGKGVRSYLDVFLIALAISLFKI
jgi:uncharacterized paraquat-inducible protein A